MESNVNNDCKQVMLTRIDGVNITWNSYDGVNSNVNFIIGFGSDKCHYVMREY